MVYHCEHSFHGKGSVFRKVRRPAKNDGSTKYFRVKSKVICNKNTFKYYYGYLAALL